MNWYKLAEAEAEEVTVTPDQFQAMTYKEKVALARNTSISPQTQQLFFTEEYYGKKNILLSLAFNISISPEIQTLFFTQEYEGKSLALRWLAWNTSFLKGFTLQEMREFTKTNKLIVYLKRLKTIREKIKL